MVNIEDIISANSLMDLPRVKHENEQEQWLIGFAMNARNPEGLEPALTMDPSDLVDDFHRSAFRAVLKLAKTGHPWDWQSVTDELGRQHIEKLEPRYLEHCCEAADSYSFGMNLLVVVKKVRSTAARRRMVDAIAQVTASLAKPSFTIEQACSDLSAAIAGVDGIAGEKDDIVSERDEVMKLLDHLDAVANGLVKRSAASTGINGLDRALNGGPRPGDVVVVAARPGVGKSSIGLQLARKLASEQGGIGMFLSGEMPSQEVAGRAMASLGGVDYGQIVDERLAEGSYRGAVESVDRTSDVDLRYFIKPGWRLSDVKRAVRKTPGLKVLAVDYLQLAQADAGSDARNRNSEIEFITRGLKEIAVAHKLIVLELSQLNRAIELRGDKKPTLADLRDSGGIEQDADTVLMLWPARDLEDGQKLVGCLVAKARKGRVGTEVALHFNGTHQRWGSSIDSLEPVKVAQAPTKKAF